MDQSNTVVKLSEWDNTDECKEQDSTDGCGDTYPIILTEEERAALENINLDTNGNNVKERKRIGYEQAGDNYILRSTRYAGVIALPSGRSIQITPKEAGNNFLNLFRLANNLKSTVSDDWADTKEGREFIDMISILYEEALRNLFRNGIKKKYVRTEKKRNYLKGKLKPEKQIKSDLKHTVGFHTDADELTYNTSANKAILYATRFLSRKTQSRSIKNRLEHYAGLLDKRIDYETMSARDITSISVSRLDRHYESIMSLTKMIIRDTYLKNFKMGGRFPFNILVNMDTVFEDALEDLLAEIADEMRLELETQKSINYLSSDHEDSQKITQKPDFLLREKDTEKIVLVMDAKWKRANNLSSSSINNSDIYQMVSYQLATKAPGLLIYPGAKHQFKKITELKDIDQWFNATTVPVGMENIENSYRSDLKQDIKKSIGRARKEKITNIRKTTVQ